MSLLNPTSIAVIGASNDEKKVGHLILRNLLTQGYKGSVFPVNPKGGDILGHTTYKTVTEIPESVDLAIIVTPAQTVCALAQECGEKGIPSLVVISAGFRESGGNDLELELQRIVERYGMNLVGPNSLGLMRPSIGMNASFGSHLPPAGTVALLSQSGALGQAFTDRAKSIGLKISLFVSMGNKTTMDECDFLELCEQDNETKVIGLYLENIRDGRRFLALARRINRTKPVIILKAGTTERGRKAASSHTGALAGSDAAVQAICGQSGIRRARSAEEFLDILRTLSLQPPLLSPSIAIVTNAGGPGVLATDAVEKEGLTMASLTPKNEEKLKSLLPATASVRNPLDVLGDALEDRFDLALQISAEDENVDGALVIVTPQVMTPTEEIAKTIIDVKRRHPLFPILTTFMGKEGVRDAINDLHQHGIPNFSCPEIAVRMLSFLKTQPAAPEENEEVPFNAKRAEKARQILTESGPGLLDEKRTGELFALYALPLPRGRVARTAKEAITIAKDIGFPVVAKISSSDVVHKTDVGGVRVDLQTEKEVSQAFDAIMESVAAKAPKARRDGILIQQFLPPGNEFIVGTLRDPGVGALVMAGLGGVYTELFADASFRLAPVSMEVAYPMLQSLRSFRILMGMRGRPPLDIAALAELICITSILAVECPAIAEIDLNPVLITEKGLTILDAKVIVK